MNTCCDKCYTICDPVSDCFDSFLIYLPADFTGEFVRVQIANSQQVSFAQVLPVQVGNFVELEIALLPTNFISPYGGPYTLEFYNGNTGFKTSFIAQDGKSYSCLSFTATVQVGSSENILRAY